MRRLLTSVLFAVGLHAASDTFTIYDRDNSTAQRPVTIGRPFVQGEFPQCANPTGTGVDATNWQLDVKNRWGDGSVKFALVTVYWTPSVRGGNTVVTLSANASCNNSGGLTAAQMANFNSGNWGGEMDVTFNGVTPTANAKTMLADNDPRANAAIGSANWPDCKNDLWADGPALTAVIVQDCTTTTKWDFGAKWDGTTMNLNSGAAYTGNCGGAASCYASLHPMFILWFYPITNQVKIDMILENEWTHRTQNQLFDIVYKTGANSSTLTTVLSQTGSRKISDLNCTANQTTCTSATANFTNAPFDNGISIEVGQSGTTAQTNTTVCSATNNTTISLCAVQNPSTTCTNCTAYMGLMNGGTRFHKFFWSGASTPAFNLIDHNLPYLITTHIYPPYDQSTSVTSVVDPGPDFTAFSATDQSDVGGIGTGIQNGGPGAQADGAPAVNQDARNLYSMGMDCGTANGKCARAFYILTATHGSLDNTTVGQRAIVGGAGLWEMPGHIPTHIRWSGATSVPFHCPTMAGVNATGGSACGTSLGAPFGKVPSKYNTDTGADFRGNGMDNAGITVPVSGAQVDNGAYAPDAPHWKDYSYYAYLMTGNYYYLEEEQQAATWYLYTPGTRAFFGGEGGAGRFGWLTNSPMRLAAFGNEVLGRAASISVDGSVEQTYYTSFVNSNAEIYEGILSIQNGVGGFSSTLTPTVADSSGFTLNTSCTNYNMTTANRWNYGRCTVMSGCTLTNGTDCTAAGFAPVSSTLHDINPPGCGLGLSGNYGSVGGAIDSATTGTTTTFHLVISSGSSLPAVGTVVTFVGVQDNGSSNWGTGGSGTGINGNQTVTATGSGTFSISYNSTGYPALKQAQYVWGGLGLITSAVQNGNGTVTITSNNVPASGQAMNIFGATGTWTNLNAQYGHGQFVKLTQTTGTVPSTGNSGALTGTVYYDTNQMDMSHSSGYYQPFMESWFYHTAGMNTDLGLTVWSNILTNGNRRLEEEIMDSTSQPFATSAQYLLGVKGWGSGTRSCGNGSDNFSDYSNTYFTTWAAAKAAMPPTQQNKTNFYTSNGDGFDIAVCDDHDYPLLARARAAWLGSTTSTDANCPGGVCTGAATTNWLNANVPYFHNAAAIAAGCNNTDIQIKFALAPRVVTGCTAPSLTSSSPLPGATFGIPYAFTFTASGTAPLTWSATGVPAWASFNTSTGVLSGTPNATGTSTMNISASNSCGGAGPTAFSATVNAAPAITSPATLPPGTQNSVYGYQMTASGGTQPLAWSLTAGALPTGLSMSSGGLISGTPSVLQSLSFTITLTDANGASTSSAITLTINPQTNGSALMGPTVCTGCVLR